MMTQYLTTWLRLKSDTSAVTAMEYALIGSLIAVAIIGAVTGLGNGIKNTFNTIANSL
jgi:pilus assembly protein Flp/PilA